MIDGDDDVDDDDDECIDIYRPKGCSHKGVDLSSPHLVRASLTRNVGKATESLWPRRVRYVNCMFDEVAVWIGNCPFPLSVRLPVCLPVACLMLLVCTVLHLYRSVRRERSTDHSDSKPLVCVWSFKWAGTYTKPINHI